MIEVKNFSKLSIKEKNYLERLTVEHDSMMLDQLRQPSKHGAIIVIIYREGEKIGGWATVEKRDEVLWLNTFVDPEMRGRGIASELVKKAVESSRMRFRSGIVFGVSHDDAGHALYRKAGFERQQEWTFNINKVKVEGNVGKHHRQKIVGMV